MCTAKIKVEVNFGDFYEIGAKGPDIQKKLAAVLIGFIIIKCLKKVNRVRRKKSLIACLPHKRKAGTDLGVFFKVCRQGAA